jgi:hypothetical protein
MAFKNEFGKMRRMIIQELEASWFSKMTFVITRYPREQLFRAATITLVWDEA